MRTLIMHFYIIICLAVAFLIGCSQTPTKSYLRAIDHYAACDSGVDDVPSIIACGKKARYQYCTENGVCSIPGNALVAYLDMLVDQHKRNEITSSELRWLYDKKLADMDAEDRRQEAIREAKADAAYRRLSDSLQKTGSDILNRSGGYGGYRSPSQSKGYFSHQESSVSAKICYYNTNNGKRAVNLKSWQSCPSAYTFND
jgi:hypothetical protein